MSRLAEILKEKNMTAYRLSKLTGISTSHLSDMITGKRCLCTMTYQRLDRLAKALGMSVEELMKEEK